jgi:hypothetical protein
MATGRAATTGQPVTESLEDLAAELFIAGELLAADGRAVIEVMLHEAAHALAAELGLRGRRPPGKGDRLVRLRLTDETAADYAPAVSGIDVARLPYLPDGPPGPGGDDGQDEGDSGGEDQGEGKLKKRGGRRAAVECACQSQPRRLQMTPSRSRTVP